MAASSIHCIFTVSRGHLDKGPPKHQRASEGLFLKAEGATKMAASSIPCISTVSREHLAENRKNTYERPKVFFAELLKSRGRPEEGRKLDSLHFYGVPWPPRWEPKRSQKKGSKLKGFFEKVF